MHAHVDSYCRDELTEHIALFLENKGSKVVEFFFIYAYRSQYWS